MLTMQTTEHEAVSIEAQAKESRFEVVAVVLLGLAALATAWASYQASLWSGVAIDSYAAADELRTEATALSEASLVLIQGDQTAVLEYAKASRTGDTQLAALVRSELMDRRVREALDAWEKTPVATREHSPLSDKYGYTVPGKAEAARRINESREEMSLARAASTTGDDYNLASILEAVALILVGIAAALNVLRVRIATMAIGAVVFVATTAWMLTLSIRAPF